MGWLTAILFGFLPPASAARPTPMRDGVIASCADFVRITDAVFTGRTGAWFAVHGERDYLGGETFGPNALSISAVVALGLGIAAILRLDAAIEAELRPTDDERQWTSVI